MFLGQENFIDKIKHLIRGKENFKEITRKQRYITRPPLNEIFKDKKSKNQAIYKAYLQYGYTLKDITEYICITLYYTTVSSAIKKIEGEDEK